MLIAAIILGVSYYNKAKHSGDNQQQPAAITGPESTPAQPPAMTIERAPAAASDPAPASVDEETAPSAEEAAAPVAEEASGADSSSEPEPADGDTPADMPAAGENNQKSKKRGI